MPKSADISETVLPERTRDALRAAQLYYMQDLTMDAIARELRTSRSSVSRLLSQARETGLVEIVIHSPLEGPSRLAADIRDRFGVTAHIVPVPDRASDVERLDRVALSAARTLASWVDSNQSVGIAWGSTIGAVSRHLPRRVTHNTEVVQLNGAGNMRTTGIMYASELLSRFGDAFGAQVHQFPVPAFFDDPATKRAFWRERSIRRVLEMQASLDLAVFGVGSPFAEVPSHVYQGGYLDAEDYRALSREHVVGDVATVFYRADGSSDGIPLNERATGPDFSVLRRAPRRVGIVAGRAKVPSLRGALRAGLITDVILDESTARDLAATPLDAGHARPHARE
ncbi:sugar-binding domain-containing protein [Microbacterium sp. ABRD28]|uniref:sugar-binding transcriptional regulator n=1 Tax=Microbacterium sp. ABRD28 TaxID=2268461 RepID=UPI000F54E7C7|nr:sugar-binding domain-containing protein [Microbacterium sp. ABRD28]AZC15137.1 sugar-binding transcriptional regulator [Microbacterium sp. ABRD28]